MHFREGWTVATPAKGNFSAFLAGFFVLFSLSACASQNQIAAQPQSLTGLGQAEQAYSAYQKGDFHLAKAIWQDQAQRGSSHAQYNLGVIYAEGRGTYRSPTQAVKWWQEAAEQGHAQAQHNLALAYMGAETDLPGKATTPDHSQARHWLEKAANQGLAHSQYYLARIITNGKANHDNMNRIVELYRYAADQGHARAQDEMAAHCFRGEGVERDYIESYYWSMLAAEQGIKKAAYRLTILDDKLSKSEMAKIQRRLSHETN